MNCTCMNPRPYASKKERSGECHGGKEGMNEYNKSRQMASSDKEGPHTECSNRVETAPGTSPSSQCIPPHIIHEVPEEGGRLNMRTSI